MKWLLGLMVLCVALAVLKAVLAALVVALLLVLAYALVTRSAETLAFLVALTAFSAASARPLAFIMTVGVVAGAWSKHSRQRLWDDHRDDPRRLKR